MYSCAEQNGLAGLEGDPLLPPCYLHLVLLKHLMRNVSGLRLRTQTLLQWNPPSGARGAAEMDIVTSALVLLCKIRCTFFFTFNTCFVLSREEMFILFSPFLPAISVKAPYILHALPSQTVFDSLSQRQIFSYKKTMFPLGFIICCF